MSASSTVVSDVAPLNFSSSKTMSLGSSHVPLRRRTGFAPPPAGSPSSSPSTVTVVFSGVS